MGAGINIWDLAGRISMDTAGSDRALTATQQKVLNLAKEIQSVDKTAQKSIPAVGKHLVNLEKDAVHAESGAKKLGEAFKVLSSTAVVADGPMGGIASRIRAIGTEATELVGVGGGPLIALTVGLSALAAGGALVANELFNLVKETAEFGNSIFKVHEKTSFAVETISALKIAGHGVGVELETMSTGLIRFVNNLGKAESGNKQLTDSFRQMGVTAFRDPDKALSQFIEHFAKLKTDEDRTLAASSVFGARFGANLVEVFNQVGGNLEEFKAHLRETGNLMGDEGATQAHKFTVQMHELELQIEGVGRSIGADLMPTASSALRELTALVEENKSAVIGWVHEFEDASRGAYVLAGAIYKIGGAITGIGDIPIPSVLRFLMDTGGLGSLYSGLAQLGRANTPAAVDPMLAKMIGMDLSEPKTGTFHAPSSGGGRHSGGDPAAEQKHLADLRLRGLTDLFKAEEVANKRTLDLRRQDFNTYAERYVEIEARRHNAVIAGLGKEEEVAKKLKKGHEAALLEIGNRVTQENTTHEQNRNKVLDERGKILDQMNDFIRDQGREITSLTAPMDKWEQALQSLVDSLKKEGVELESNTMRRIRENITRAKEMELIQGAIRLRSILDAQRERSVRTPGGRGERAKGPGSVIDLGGGSIVTLGPDGLPVPANDATRSRRVFQDFHDRLAQLADSVTSVLSSSIRIGFEQGAAAGFKSLLQGFLDILARMAEQWLASSIFKMLQSAVDPGKSGGGFWGKLFGILIGAAAGSVGGHAGGYSKMPLPFAHGGIVPGIDRGYDSVPAMLRPGETVVPRGESMGGGHTFIVNINVPTTQAAGSQATMYQVSKQMHGMMAKAALVG